MFKLKLIAVLVLNTCLYCQENLVSINAIEGEVHTLYLKKNNDISKLVGGSEIVYSRSISKDKGNDSIYCIQIQTKSIEDVTVSKGKLVFKRSDQVHHTKWFYIQVFASDSHGTALSHPDAGENVAVIKYKMVMNGLPLLVESACNVEDISTVMTIIQNLGLLLHKE